MNIAETLLLNAGASVLTVQALLGHKRVDTTLRYARVYDSTVAADYARATRQIDHDGFTSLEQKRTGCGLQS